MKAVQILNILKAAVPIYTNFFTDNLSIVSIVPSGSTALVTTNVNHNLKVGEAISIVDAYVKTPVASVTKNGDRLIVVTSVPHDFTEGHQINATLVGATQPAYNATFEVDSVPSPTELELKCDPGLPASATGTIFLLEMRYNGYIGRYKVASTPSPTTFTYTLAAPLSIPAGFVPSTQALVKVRARIDADADFKNFLGNYSPQQINKFYMCVCLDDVATSKSRFIKSDAVNTIGHGDDPRQRILRTFTVYVVVPITDKLSAREARDTCQDDIEIVLLKSLLNTFLDTNRAELPFSSIVYLGQKFEGIDSSVYGHSFQFQVIEDLTLDDLPDPISAAFRHIDLDMGTQIGSEILHANIDLDVTP